MKRQSGKLRIIGGKNKGRNIIFPTADGLRPTADRVRETLFNWLAGHIKGSHCLDLFAGSGALGLEALSRGAESVTFVESNYKAAQALNLNLTKIGSESAPVLCENAVSYISKSNQKFDIVFLDPPYQSQLLQKSIQLLSKQELLNTNSWIYVEYSAHTQAPDTPENWQLYRSTKAGDASAMLYQTSQG